MIKRILVGLGDVEYTRVAVAAAVDLAQRHEAEITAVTVVDHVRLDQVGPVPIGGGGAANELRAYRLNLTRSIIEQAIAACEDACRKAAVPYRLLYEEREPFDYFISASRYHDLMVFGLRHLFEHGVIDEPPDELVNLIESGVRPILAVSREPRQIRKVLIAYGGSMPAAKTMRQFVQMRLWDDVQLRIVAFGASEEKAANWLSGAAEYCRAHGYDPESEHVASAPSKALLPDAERWGADLIVLGNSSKGLLRRRIFGETTCQAIRESQIPLFLSQ